MWLLATLLCSFASSFSIYAWVGVISAVLHLFARVLNRAYRNFCGAYDRGLALYEWACRHVFSPRGK